MNDATPVVDVHLILRDGDRILLSRRGGAYGYGQWHAPSGKLEPGEPLHVAAAREGVEETGVVVDPHRLRLVHVVHHRSDSGRDRIGFFFEARQWQHDPWNREPDKCLALQWFPVDRMPEDIVPYPAAGLRAYLAGDTGVTVHGWEHDHPRG